MKTDKEKSAERRQALAALKAHLEAQALEARMRKCAYELCRLPFEQKRKTQNYCCKKCQVAAYHLYEKRAKEAYHGKI